MGNFYVGTLRPKSIYIGTKKVLKIYKDTQATWVALNCLCFTANQAGSSVSMTKVGTSTLGQNFKVSTDLITWTEFIPGTTTITLTNKGDKVYFKGNNPNGVNESTETYYYFSFEGKIAASGSIMSLVDNGMGTLTTIPNSYCFYNLFSYNTRTLITPPELSATTLTDFCYAFLFSSCKSLTTAPKLPATTLSERCYYLMFEECTSLTTPPALPATTLAKLCYTSMFQGCTSLTTAPALPATTLADNCYYNMFSGCTSLTTPPELPATTLTDGCYGNMFNGCTSLTTVPDLPATTLTDSCYSSMFSSCTRLTKTPRLFATELDGSCYSQMFSNCTSLVTVSLLPSSSLSMFSYERMFSGCTSLIVSDTQTLEAVYAWKLPTDGTFTQGRSQTSMFTNCAGTRASDSMAGASGLSYTYYTLNKPLEAPSENCLCFTANQAGSSVSMTKVGTSTLGQNFKVSTDLITWTTFTPGTTTITLVNVGDKVYFYGNNPNGVSQSSLIYYQFVMTGSIAASGNIMSLIDDGLCTCVVIPNNYCFCKLFYDCTALTSTPELPATTLKKRCYVNMFNGCTSLTTASELPATELAEGCYMGMFDYCLSLVTPSDLIATTLAENCYQNMFRECTSLIISDAQTSEAQCEWRMPVSDTFTNTCSQSNMFTDCPGTRSSDNMSGEAGQSYTYYTLNKPVSPFYTVMYKSDLSSTLQHIERVLKRKQHTLLPNMFTPPVGKCLDCWIINGAQYHPGDTITVNEDINVVASWKDAAQYTISFNANGGSGSLSSIIAYEQTPCTIPSSTFIAPETQEFKYWTVGSTTGEQVRAGSTYTFTQSTTLYAKWGNISTPLCFTANTADSVIELYPIRGSEMEFDFSTSTDGTTWTPFTFDDTITLEQPGDKVYFKGNNPQGLYDPDMDESVGFSMGGSVAASGNIMSLIDNGACDTFVIPCNYCFLYLFCDCEGLTTPPELPATTLTEGCYMGMFYGCTTLTTAPDLLATTTVDYCYQYMFYGCTSLTTAPALPVTTLTQSCYYGMFYDCTSLTTPPTLPATTLAQYCYRAMFYGCTSLTTAPELPATELVDSCYNNMFYGCTDLTTPPALPATTLAQYCYQYMFYGCTSLTTAPELPATKLTSSYNYSKMFYNCTSLIVSDTQTSEAQYEWRIPTSGTFTNTSRYIQSYMFTGCLGTRSSDNMTASLGTSRTYYTQNTPE